MYFRKNRMSGSVAALALILLLPFAGISQTPTTGLSKIHVKNFGRMNDHYFRGAQPEGSDYRDLAGIGVKTVIDLTQDGRSDEPAMVRRAGMTFYRIPLTTSDRPSDAAVTQFLKLVNDPGNWPVYVHCQGGRHRTGVMTAVYRMTQDGWTATRAYNEMRQFKFEGFPGHPELKQFVFDYYDKLVASGQNKTAQKTGGSSL